MDQYNYQSTGVIFNRWSNKKQAKISRISNLHPTTTLFIGLESCEKATGEVLASNIFEVAIKIKESGSKLIAVCTDNAKNNIAALDFGPFSAQMMSNHSFIRFPCVCHDVNLTVKDIFSD